MDLTIRARIHPNRRALGQLDLTDAAGDSLAGPFPCLALADQTAATLHHNPERNPMLPYGDTPTGRYRVMILPKQADVRAYGTCEVLLLLAVAGPCVVACSEAPGKEARAGLLIHSGDENPALAIWLGLRPTYGCIRTKQAALAAIVAQLKARAHDHVWCDVTELAA